jgi:hypothetical protein
VFHPPSYMESIDTLNQRLIDEFGSDSDTNRPIFRIVWADDEIEKRLTDCLDNGVALLYPIVMEMKKYPYLKDTYVLERLVAVPEENKRELLAIKLSYEPIWAYRDDDDNPLPPIWSATKFIIDTLYAAIGKKSLAKYVDSEKNTTPEGREQRIIELQEELFGDETETTDALRYKEGIVVPNNYKKEN